MDRRCWAPRHKNHVDNHRSSTLSPAYDSFTLTETATLYYAEHFTWTQISTPYFCVGQESESESVPSLFPVMENGPLWLNYIDGYGLLYYAEIGCGKPSLNLCNWKIFCVVQ